jgi:hypothetical protein
MYNPKTGKTNPPTTLFDKYGRTYIEIAGAPIDVYNVAWYHMRGYVPEGPKLSLSGVLGDNRWCNIGSGLKQDLLGLKYLISTHTWLYCGRKFQNKTSAAIWAHRNNLGKDGYLLKCLENEIPVTCDCFPTFSLCDECAIRLLNLTLNTPLCRGSWLRKYDDFILDMAGVTDRDQLPPLKYPDVPWIGRYERIDGGKPYVLPKLRRRKRVMLNSRHKKITRSLKTRRLKREGIHV